MVRFCNSVRFGSSVQWGREVFLLSHIKIEGLIWFMSMKLDNAMRLRRMQNRFDRSHAILLEDYKHFSRLGVAIHRNTTGRKSGLRSGLKAQAPN
jgi:hypothetical protein